MSNADRAGARKLTLEPTVLHGLLTARQKYLQLPDSPLRKKLARDIINTIESVDDTPVINDNIRQFFRKDRKTLLQELRALHNPEEPVVVAEPAAPKAVETSQLQEDIAALADLEALLKKDAIEFAAIMAKRLNDVDPKTARKMMEAEKRKLEKRIERLSRKQAA